MNASCGEGYDSPTPGGRCTQLSHRPRSRDVREQVRVSRAQHRGVPRPAEHVRIDTHFARELLGVAYADQVRNRRSVCIDTRGEDRARRTAQCTVVVHLHAVLRFAPAVQRIACFERKRLRVLTRRRPR